MPSVVTDAHTIVWYLANDARLSRTAMQALDLASATGEPIYVPSICLVELTYPVERGRLASLARDRLTRALDEPLAPAGWFRFTGWSPTCYNSSTAAKYLTCQTASLPLLLPPLECLWSVVTRKFARRRCKHFGSRDHRWPAAMWSACP